MIQTNPNATAARPVSVDGAHWYTKEGEPMHSVIAKKTGQPRPTTLGDAKKLGLLPSVTTILKILHKEALVNWQIEQAVLAVVTTPRKPDEKDDEFIYRVLYAEKVQDEEASAARDLGTRMHNTMEALLNGGEVVVADSQLLPWVDPAYGYVRGLCPTTIAVESIVVGSGFAGKIDFIGDAGAHELVIDFKTTKKLPTSGSWDEHRLQLAAYARARAGSTSRVIKTANLYISTVEQGKFAYFENPPWMDDYLTGFMPLVTHWQWKTGHKP